MRRRTKFLLVAALVVLALLAEFKIRGTASLIILPVMFVDGWLHPGPLPLW